MVRALHHLLMSIIWYLAFYYLVGSRGWTRTEGCILSIMWRKERRGSGLNHCPLGKTFLCPTYTYSLRDVVHVPCSPTTLTVDLSCVSVREAIGHSSLWPHSLFCLPRCLPLFHLCSAGSVASTRWAGSTSWITSHGPPRGSAPPWRRCETTNSGNTSAASCRAPCSSSTRGSYSGWDLLFLDCNEFLWINWNITHCPV